MVIAFAAVTMLWHMAGWTQTLNTFQDGEPARASEVNDNFAALKAKIEALEQDLEALTPFQHPDRYYPNWTHEPDFYLTLPPMAGSWAGFLSENDDWWYWFDNGSPYERARYNINLMAHTGGVDSIRVWAGAFVRRAPDIDARHKSQHLAGVVSNSDPPHSGDLFFYHVRLSHYGRGGGFSILNYSKDPLLSWGETESDWQYAMTRGMVESLLTGFYALLELTSTTHVKHCPTINLYLKLDYSVDVTSSDCEAIPLDLP